jgi:hypothetical protein
MASAGDMDRDVNCTPRAPDASAMSARSFTTVHAPVSL